jgi:AcrR family transcriptional regulator
MPDLPSKRGRTHDAEGAREAILNAAEKTFAEHGFDGARIDVIAKESGYNKSLIFQYFDDKLSLYAAVIRRADDQTRDVQNQALAEFRRITEPLDFAELRRLLREYIGWYFDFLIEHPNITRIYNWEMAEGWQIFSKVLSERDFQDVEDFAPLFQKIQAVGLMRPGLDPLLQFTAANFVTFAYLAIVPFYQSLMLKGVGSPQELKLARDFLVEFITDGLLIQPP